MGPSASHCVQSNSGHGWLIPTTIASDIHLHSAGYFILRGNCKNVFLSIDKFNIVSYWFTVLLGLFSREATLELALLVS